MNQFLQYDLLFAMPGITEWIIIAVLIIFFFGGKKIPGLMRGLGRGMREFKDAKNKKDDNVGNNSSEKNRIPQEENQTEK